MTVAMARAMVVAPSRDAVLVADQNQADANGPNSEGQERKEPLTEGELGVVHLGQTVCGTDVQVDATAEGQDEPNQGIVHRCGANDEGPDHDAESAEEVERQGLRNRQARHRPGQDDEVRDLLNNSMRQTVTQAIALQRGY